MFTCILCYLCGHLVTPVNTLLLMSSPCGIACRPLSLQEIVKIGTNIASALAYMHKLGFLHADVKPDNVGISNVGSPSLIAKLLDFGLVKRIGQEWHDTAGIGMP